MTQKVNATLPTSRRGFLTLCAGAAAGLYSPSVFASRNGSLAKTLTFENLHTGDRLKATYWVEGRYIPQALSEINYVLRDHRSNEVATIDTRLLDVLYDLHGVMGSARPFQVISGYRSPETNSAMRNAGNRGVAKRSYHMEGMAVDVALEDRTITSLRNGALSLHAGGVGFYPRSGFVHVDVGPVRSW